MQLVLTPPNIISDEEPPGLEFSQFQETPSRNEVKDIFLPCDPLFHDI